MVCDWFLLNMNNDAEVRGVLDEMGVKQLKDEYLEEYKEKKNEE